VHGADMLAALPPIPRSARVPRAAGPRTLSHRALNRALLARQLLLRRRRLTVPTAVEHLVGLQAQNPSSPYLALWSRLSGFRPEQLAGPLVARELVRTVVMRGTLHLVTADDCVAVRPAVQEVLTRMFAASPFGKALAGIDETAVMAAGRDVLAAEPLPSNLLGARLAERWPDRDPASLAQAVRALLPTVQVPPRGVWGQSGVATWAPAETWLGRPVDRGASVDELVLRYLAAFGPATVKDAQTWSGLTHLREVFDRLRSRLRVFRDPSGAELFDLDTAPRPSPDTPAPVRFLPDFDNILLSHADRSRIVPDAHRARISSVNSLLPGTFLLDGHVSGTWSLSRDPGRAGTARLLVTPFTKLSRADRSALHTEADLLLSFLVGVTHPSKSVEFLAS
jgi:hypothetical protein